MRRHDSAAAERTFVPGVDEVEGERRMDANRRVETFGRLPGAETNAGDIFAFGAGRMKRDGVADCK